MSKLWEDLKDNMKDWGSSAVEKAEEMSRVAMSKTEELTRISKIKFEIMQLQRDIDHCYEDLGRLAYSHTKNDHMATFSGHSEFFEIVSKIDKLSESITKKDDEIEAVKKEYGLDDLELNNKDNISPLEDTESDSENYF
ncbi:MAG: hypothetical protein CMG74_02820 [Candidatus Marinimicrobia bacterium]|nr:hypothetical protein [Candidatus Neomarinimicrobiota bacterium]